MNVLKRFLILTLLFIICIPCCVFAGTRRGHKNRNNTFDSLSKNSSAPLGYKEVGNIVSNVWDLNDGLTQNECKVIRAALLTVGRIPYQLTSKHPDRPGKKKEITDNAISKAADNAGTLDCSHWVDWIYSIAVDDSLGSGNTSYLAKTRGEGSLKLLGRNCSLRKLKRNLRPGDIMVYTKDEHHNYGHTAIFLTFLPDGQMAYVHESSAEDNVALHIGTPFGNGGSSPVYYFRHRGKEARA